MIVEWRLLRSTTNLSVSLRQWLPFYATFSSNLPSLSPSPSHFLSVYRCSDSDPHPPPPPLHFTCLSPPSPNRIFLLGVNTMKAPFAIKASFFSSQNLVDETMGKIVDVPLAQTGEGIAECELLRWFISEGDEVYEFQPLCEVQSDKATIEITSRYKGKVLEILHIPRNIVKVGESLLKMVVEKSIEPSTTNELGAIDLPPGSEVYDLPGCSDVLSAQGSHERDKVLSTPAVRNLAKEYGININDVRGTGNDGRVLKEDVVKLSIRKGTAGQIVFPKIAPGPFMDGSQYQDVSIPLRGYQRAMVKAMTVAASVPHFYFVEEINCEALVGIKAAFQSLNSEPDIKHTVLPFLIKSLSVALLKYPLMNSSFREESTEVVLKGLHNIGVAMATPHGLVVPNIKKVQALSVLEITRELSRLHKLALDNRLCPEDVSGGTITLSNIGSIGGRFGSPLLNVPESAIIALGRIQKVPRFDDRGDVSAASIMNVSIGADHRIVDGATVAKFCKEWKQCVEEPHLLILSLR